MNLREYAEQQTKAAERKKDTVTGVYKAQQLPDKYKRIYRAVFEFHARHTPAPQTAAEWLQLAQDVGKASSTLDNDPFAIQLLSAVYSELERQAASPV